MNLWGACLGAEALAFLLAVVLWRRSRSAALLPVVLLLAVPIAVDVPMRLLEEGLRGAPRPLAGVDAAALHVHTALLLAWPAALAATSQAVFIPPASYPSRDRRRGAAHLSRVAASWVALAVALALAHPLPRGWLLAVEHAAHVAAAIIGAAALVRGWGRAWSRPHACVSLLLCIELVSVTVGPWADKPAQTWSAAQALYLLAFGMLSVMFTAWLWSDARGRT